MVSSEQGVEAKRRVTIRDVAREAGVSLGAVSHVLNPNPNSTIGVGEQAALRVHEAVRRIGFRPHAGARSIRSNRFKNIGFFIARKGVESRPPEEYLTGVNDAAQRQGYRVVLVGLKDDASDYHGLVSSKFYEKILDALIVASYHHLSAEIYKALAGIDLPVVYLNDRCEHNAIWLDDHIGARIMTDHLQERGYRKIVYAIRQYAACQQVEQMHYSAAERLGGYRQSMTTAGLVPDVRMIEIPEALKQNPRIQDDWLYDEDGSLPDAIFAYDDDLANTIAKMLTRKKIRVPEDVALAGYNGAYASLCSWRPLTTMRIPSYKMGGAAFDMAIRIIERSDSLEISSTRFNPELLIGEST